MPKMDAELKQKVLDFKANRNRILGRLFKRSYQFVADIAGEYLRNKGYSGFRVGHLVLLIHIDLEGTTVNTLAQRAGITKQAMSKLVQELQENGFVETTKHPSDARSIMVTMTDKGANFILDWKGCSQIIDDKMKAVLGEEKLEKMKDILEELVDYYESNSGKTMDLSEMMKVSSLYMTKLVKNPKKP
jgi:DNA-binding MarR family transcriptional regulator